MSAALYRFDMWAVVRRDDPYYYTNWDRKRRVTALGATQQEAINEAARMLGDPGRRFHWTFRVISAVDNRIPVEAES